MGLTLVQQVDPGSLPFCTGVGYIACLREPVALTYDGAISNAYSIRTTRLGLEFPTSATSTCLTAFQTYLCALSFPQCVLDPAGSGEYVELPMCWKACLSAELACSASADQALRACNQAVAAGRVAINRPDVVCQGCAGRASVRLALFCTVLALLVAQL